MSQPQLINFWNFKAQDTLETLTVSSVKEIKGIFSNKRVRVFATAELNKLIDELIHFDVVDNKTRLNASPGSQQGIPEYAIDLTTENILFFYSLLLSGEKLLNQGAREQIHIFHNRFLKLLLIDNDTKLGAGKVFEQFMEKITKLQSGRDKFIQSLEDAPEKKAIALKNANRYSRYQSLARWASQGLICFVITLLDVMILASLVPEIPDYLGNLIHSPFMSPRGTGILLLTMILCPIFAVVYNLFKRLPGE
jgi:hypothetical protein